MGLANHRGSCHVGVMDEFTATMIGHLEGRRRVAVAMLEGHVASALGRAMPPELIAELEAEVAECDVELAKLCKD